MKVLIPDRVKGAKCWAKAIDRVDPGKDAGYALEGTWLERGAAYDLPAGLMVVTCDKRRSPADHSAAVTLWQVPRDDEGDGWCDLVEVKTWTNKRGVIGSQILKGVNSRLAKAKHPPVRPAYATVVEAPPRGNTRAEGCYICGKTVPPGKGLLVRRGGRMRVVHAGSCPPLRNTWPGECARCGGWIEARAGHLESHEDRPDGPYAVPGSVGVRRWRVVHPGDCPPDPAPRPAPPVPDGPRVNSRPGPCELCHQNIRAGEGRLVGTRGDWHLIHPGDCPPYPHNPGNAPTWTIRERDTAAGMVRYDYPAGTIARVELPHGPVDGPGWRLLDDGSVGVVGVVVAATVARERDPDEDVWIDVVTTVWRVATGEEAAPIMEREDRRLRRARLSGRARLLLATSRAGVPSDAVAPSPEEMEGVRLADLPEVPLPAGTGGVGRYATRVYVDEPGGVVWTVVHNGAEGDDWSASNWGGYVAFRHPLTPGRRGLLAELGAEIPP